MIAKEFENFHSKKYSLTPAENLAVLIDTHNGPCYFITIEFK